MPDNTSFPQIPATVWWGVRNLLNKSPRATIGEDLLGVELNVQPAAARQYVTELRRVGVLNEESKATELANRWRLDDSYADAVSEILKSAYPEALITVATGESDRSKAIEWFKRQGLGEGSARNKTATYLLIASPVPGEAAPRGTGQNGQKSRVTKAKPEPKAVREPTETPKREDRAASGEAAVFPVNLNLQIHISADASSDQIEAIFSAMRKHLGNVQFS